MDKRPTLIIAEAGICHQGDLGIAKQMVDVAVDAKVDYVKWQTFFGTQPDFKHLEFTKDEWRELFGYCESKGMKWFSTPFDFESIDFLNDSGMEMFKIPSGMVTNYAYLEKLKLVRPKKLIMSTGMCEEYEIDLAVARMALTDCILLQCTTAYPCPFNEVNLKAMLRLGWYGDYGLSDHTLGIEIPIAAVAMGASVIEKHFTLSRDMEGPDHAASLEPHELKRMVEAIRNVEAAMGDGIKRPTPSELEVRDEIRARMGCS